MSQTGNPQRSGCRPPGKSAEKLTCLPRDRRRSPTPQFATTVPMP